MKSLLEALGRLSVGPRFPVPGGFQSCPKSLKEVMRVASLPNPEIEKWVEDSSITRWCNADFTEEFQGFAHEIDDIWFLSIRKKILRIKWISSDFIRILQEYEIEELGVSFSEYDHFGDIEFQDGLVFVPVESKEKRRVPLLLALSKDLELVGWAKLHDSQTNTAQCCAFSPWNRLLYVSLGDGLYGYNVASFFARIGEPSKWGTILGLDPGQKLHLYQADGSPYEEGAQGIVFSSNGRLYVTRAKGYVVIDLGVDEIKAWDNYIEGYCALTGRLLSQREVNFSGTGDEIEGMAIYPAQKAHIAVLFNIQSPAVAVHIYHYKHPIPSHPV